MQSRSPANTLPGHAVYLGKYRPELPISQSVREPCRLHAALVGFVEYPVVGLTSGLAPVTALQSNATTLGNVTTAAAFEACPVPGTGPGNVVYAGRLVGPPLAWRPFAAATAYASHCLKASQAKRGKRRKTSQPVSVHACSAMPSTATWRRRPGRYGAPFRSTSSPCRPRQVPLLSPCKLLFAGGRVTCFGTFTCGPPRPALMGCRTESVSWT